MEVLFDIILGHFASPWSCDNCISMNFEQM